MSLPATYAILLAAIVLEVAGTSALLASAQFTRPGPSALVVACYGGALLLISITFRTIPMGIVYAIWSGLGMVLIVAVGWVGVRPAARPAGAARDRADPRRRRGAEPVLGTR